MTPKLVTSSILQSPGGTDFAGCSAAKNCTNDPDELLNERAFSKLRWRCRRGLLENDLLIEKFFARHEATLTIGQAKGLNDLMALSDNDLLDLLLRRKEPSQLLEAESQASASTFEARVVLNLLRPQGNSAAAVPL